MSARALTVWSWLTSLAIACTQPLQPETVTRPVATTGPVELEGTGPLGENVPPGYSCPMKVAGVRVTLVPIEGGEALVFTDATEPSDSLRRSVLQFAAQYDWSGQLAPRVHGRRRLVLPFPTQVAYADTVDGARLEIEALDLDRLPDLEEHLRQRVALMNRTHTCGSP